MSTYHVQRATTTTPQHLCARCMSAACTMAHDDRHPAACQPCGYRYAGPEWIRRTIDPNGRTARTLSRGGEDVAL